MSERAIIHAIRIVDGTGAPHPDGSYVEFVVRWLGKNERYRMSLGATEALRDEIIGLIGSGSMPSLTSSLKPGD